MSKRNAGSELNADNWDQEEEQEEAGVFKQADGEKMAKRQVLKAKRRMGSSQDSTDGPKAFAGFAGFTGFKPAEQRTTTVSSSLFSGTSSSPKSSAATSIFGSSSLSSTSNSSPLNSASNGHSSKSPQKSAYTQQLKALNESVLQWIQKHVTSNPYCILTPIFNDYEKHLEEISKKHPEPKSPEKRDEEKKEEKSEKGDEEKEESKTEQTEEKEKKEPTAVSTSFSFGAKSTGSVFGSSSSSTSSSTSGFSFGASANPIAPSTGGFSFAVSKPADSAASATAAEEEEYVPPKPEVSQITEEDAKYTKKCKLFYQKDGSWKDKGVGFLYLKPCGEKTQLLIRADTNLGNVLLNILLNSSIPMSRQGKNNVTMICVPNPPLEEKDKEASSKPVSMLIRVKTSEDADELLEKLKEAKDE
ncbi:hypothetical protein CAPTEDRAFT_220122 [Capitella teleta]|uniref:RanBD1 domain-containing protein n=1 Tax=Capitella teleta TaxID=283909 RepID=R7UKL1_CAPTE|nr:hypothetical protein CAPTEDRAFT_220122 [Capitella teleta]|eukprot:ELU06618.1 hypothetical protein CAPTEDRAFT_220122 [Capitella teleta]